MELFDSEPLRSLLQQKFSEASFVDGLRHTLRQHNSEGTLQSILQESVDALKLNLTIEGPWLKTLQFAVPEFVRGSKVVPASDVRFLDVTQSIVEGTENDAVAVEAIESLCPGLRTHPDRDEYVNAVILPFRSFALCHIVCRVVEVVSLHTKTVTERRPEVFVHLSTFSDSDDDAAQALRWAADGDLKSIQRACKRARRDTLLRFCEAYLTKNMSGIEVSASKSLSFALCAAATESIRRNDLKSAQEQLTKAAKVGDPVAQCQLAVLLERGNVGCKAAIRWYEECLDSLEKWGLYEDFPWGSAKESHQTAQKRLKELAASKKARESVSSKKSRPFTSKCVMVGCTIVTAGLAVAYALW